MSEARAPLTPARLWQGEIYLAKRLRALCLGDVLGGVCDAALVRERIRAAILEHHLAELTCGRRDGQPVSWRQAFEDLYGQRLEQP